MRRRPWVLVLAVFLLAGFFSVFVLARYVNRSNLIRGQILKASAALPGHLDLKKTHLKPTSLYIYDLTYVNADSSLLLTVPEVHLKLDPKRLFYVKGDFIKIVSGVMLIRPKVDVRIKPGGDTTRASAAGREALDWNEFSFLDQVSLQDGSVLLSDQSGDTLLDLHSFDGWMNNETVRQTTFGLTFTVSRDTISEFSLQGSMNPQDRELTLRLNVDDLGLGRVDLPRSIPVELKSGGVSLTVNLSYDSLNWSLNGGMSLSGGALMVKQGPFINDIELRGRFEEKRLLVDGTCSFEGDSALVSAEMSFRDGIVLDAEAEIARGRLGKHLVTFADLRPRDAPVGTIHARAKFHWEAAGGDWTANAEATADSLQLVIGTIHDVEAGLSWSRERSYLSFDSALATYYGMDVRGKGAWTPLRPLIFNVGLDISGRCDPSTLPEAVSPLHTKTADVHVDITMNRSRGWLIEGSGTVRADEDSTIGLLKGEYSLSGFTALLELPLTADTTESAGADSAKALFKQEGVKKDLELELDNVVRLARWWRKDWIAPEPINRLNVDSKIRFNAEGYGTNSEITDPRSGFSLGMAGTFRVENDSTFGGICSYTLSRFDHLVGNGDFSFDYSNNRVNLQHLVFNDYLTFRGALDIAAMELDSTVLQLNDFDLGDLADRSGVVPHGLISGFVNGRADLSGSVKNPHIEAQFDLRDGRYKDLSRIWGVLSVASNGRGDLEILESSLGREAVPIIELSGKYNIPENKLDIQVVSPGSDAGIIAEAVTGQKHLMSGNLLLWGNVAGSLQRPQWLVNARLTGVKTGGIAFDSVRVRVNGRTTSDGEHIINIDQLEMVRNEMYRFSARGSVPFDGNTGTVTADLEGDILSILPQMTPFITEAKGSGRVRTSWLVQGTNRASISESSIDILDGAITFEDVLPGIEDLQLIMSIDTTGKLSITQCDGAIGAGGLFEIGNSRGTPGDTTFRDLPIRLDAIGLDLGVILVRTIGDNGIPLKIPGVMKDYARVLFLGRKDLQSEGGNKPVATSAVSPVPPAVPAGEVNRGESRSEWFRISGASPGEPILWPGDSAAVPVANSKPEGGVAGGTVGVSVNGADSLLNETAETLQNEMGFLNPGGRPGSGLRFSGAAVLSHGRITYPPETAEGYRGSGKSGDTFIERLLNNARWDISAVVGRDVRYVREIKGFENAPFFRELKGLLDRISLEALVEPTDPDNPIRTFGRVGDGSFRLQGKFVSTDGTIELLDQTFHVERVEVAFDRSDILPVVSAKAYTRITDVNTGFPRTVYLTLYVIDPQTGERTTRGRWGDFTLVLESPSLGGFGEELSQEEILAAMGYSIGEMGSRFGSIGGAVLTRAVSRTFLRPIEQDVERLLGLDLVRVNPVLSSGIFGQPTLVPRPGDPSFQYREGLAGRYMPGSTVRVGKYITSDLYLSYTGQWGNEVDYTTSSELGRMGLLETWNLTYRISRLSPSLVIDAEWEYDNLEDLNNRSVKIRYTFTF